MSPPHEEAARSAQRTAQHFNPVLMKGEIAGWTFLVHGVGHLNKGFLWITKDHEITGDVRIEREEAAEYLKQYIEYKKTAPSQVRSARLV